MNVLILEDDIVQLKIIHNILQSEYREFDYTCCLSYGEAQTALAIRTYDIFILDIRLSPKEKELNGIHFAYYLRSIRTYRTTPIVFLTALPDQIERCLNRIHCYSYIVKPFTKEKILYAIQNILFDRAENFRETSLVVKLLNNVNTRIEFSDILFLKIEGHNLMITCLTNSYTIGSYSLRDIYALLPPYFIRCHRKYILNVHFITSYDKTNLYVSIKNETIPVGRVYKKSLEDKILASSVIKL